MASNFGLKEFHEANIVNFMRFTRSQRSISIRSIQSAFEDIKNSKLKNETTLTVDEVEDMIGEMWSIIKEELDAELGHQSHTYILLLRQLFLQAEEYHLRMHADISELENKELLDKIKAFENEQFSGSKKSNNYVAPKLEPVNDTGSTRLLKDEINRLNEENQRLKDKVRSLENKLGSMADELTSTSSRISTKNDSNKFTGDLNELERQMAGLKSELVKSKEASVNNEKALENEMVAAKHRYLEVLEQLKLAEKELEKKFNQTNAYKNMKQMLEKKNEQLKEYKKRLERYEPDS